ncbi:LAFE_0E00584g1_1 [Lachancea fermentati]|uniref:DNA ligase n=1 Tax=Lachancea fermentati TaxID=4955 RepID=A0A1G4MCA3_LACFM|nr:LAFE_0E00584g1_1 [Lachancea fermentati]
MELGENSHSENFHHQESTFTLKNFAPSPEFQWFCNEFFVKLDDLVKLRHKLGKSFTVKSLEVIIHFIKLWRTTVGDDFYPILLLIFPYRDQRAYNIKDYTLVKTVCKYLKLPKNSLTEARLLNWKQNAARGTSLSSFCVEEIKKRRKEPIVEHRMTIDELNGYLDDLSKGAGQKHWGYSSLASCDSFRSCLERMSFIELKYFFDIILKNRIIGGLEHKFFNCWHPDALEYLSVVSDLRILATRLWNPSIRLRKTDLSINIGHAFAPQLAKRLHMPYDKISQKLHNDFLVEEKMDGERIQLHYLNYGAQLKFFSRRGTDYTHLYGDSVGNGIISKFLKLSPDVKECVIDGEMVTFDKEKMVILPFGIVKSSAVDELISNQIGTEQSGYRPLFMAFDLVFLNGSSLSKLPLHIRKEYLAKILTPSSQVVEIIPYVRANDSNTIQNSLQKAISLGSEGIVLKHYKSTYHFGSRNDTWIKVKPEYLEQFGENMDLIIIGRDPGKKDSLMCGLGVTGSEKEGDIIILSDDEELNARHEAVVKFVSFCTIANGISDREFKEIDRRTRGKWIQTRDALPPPEILEFGTKLPVEWIKPEDSIVLEVKARSISNNNSSSTKFKTGSTLYGAYCRGIRSDKDWTSCATFQQYLRAKQSHNYYRYRKRSQEVSPRKKRTLSKNKKHLFLENEAISKKYDSTIFQGLLFYVLSDYVDPQTKTRILRGDINRIIKSNGGAILHNIDMRPEELFLLRIIAGKTTIECKALMERGYDIIKPSWIFDCIKCGFLSKLEPKHCLAVSRPLYENSKLRVDSYGVSFQRFIDESDYDGLMEFGTNVETAFNSVPEELQEVPLFLFNKYTFFIAQENCTSQVLQELETKIKWFGGNITANLSSATIIVVVNFPKKNTASAC